MSPAGTLLRSLAWCCLVPGLTSCINPVGPKYRKPDVTDITPAQWSWQPANPRDDTPKGEWWKIFRDDELDRLQERALTASPNVQAAVARVEQARANASATIADFFPDIRFKPSFKREQTSGHLPSPIPVPIPSARISSFSVPLDLNYEIDFWGKLRRSTESARATAVATVADYHNVLLTLTADVTIQYFALRALDSELAVLRRTIELRETSLKLMDQRFNAGAISETDHARARSELSNARAELADAKLRRQEIAATLALLCGDPAGLTSFASTLR